MEPGMLFQSGRGGGGEGDDVLPASPALESARTQRCPVLGALPPLA